MVNNLDKLTEVTSIEEKQNLKYTLIEKDSNGRTIYIYKLLECFFGGENLSYPNLIVKSFKDKKIYEPIREQTMSLSLLTKEKKSFFSNPEKKFTKPLFFFSFNFDNYFHFVYDTLPYLISFFEVKKKVTNLKLLVSNDKNSINGFYPFVKEFLKEYGIDEEDLVFLDANTVYNEIYFSSSYTHDYKSNLSPREEVYDFLKKITPTSCDSTPKKIYVSRRSWLHNNFSNIGTNYTTRRKFSNEDEVVSFLTQKGFHEVFTENLSTVEKLQMFKNAEIVIGAIGGGICNVLFSNPETKLVSLVSPGFLEINQRFLYSLSKVNLTLFQKSFHIENDKYKRFMRVVSEKNNIVGEIVEVLTDTLIVQYTNEPVAGWNLDKKYEQIELEKKDCKILDFGLNSEWGVDMVEFEKLINSIC